MEHEHVYLLYHVRETGELLFIGAYRSESDAKAAIGRLKNKPGFIDHPDCFEYHQYQLGADNFSDGFNVDEDDVVDSEDESKKTDLVN